MNRRKAVQGIFLFSLGTGVVFSCQDKYSAIQDLNLTYILAEDKQIDLIDKLSNEILPFHLIPALEYHTAIPFILKMMEDCLSIEDRNSCIAGYKSFDTEVQTLLSVPFLKLSPDESRAFVQSINNEEVQLSKPCKTLFDTVKRFSITYLLNTEPIQRGSRYYEMAPGYFRGDIHIDDWSNKNAL